MKCSPVAVRWAKFAAEFCPASKITVIAAGFPPPPDPPPAPPPGPVPSWVPVLCWVAAV